MAKRTHSANWKSVREQFTKELYSNAKAVNKAAASVLVQASNKFVQKVHEMSALPMYTGNLRDSIASAVSISGRIVRASYLDPSYKDTNPYWRPQSMGGRKRIIGLQEAVEMVRSNDYPRRGVAATLFVAVPYAQAVNDGELGKSLGNIGYIERLEQQFEADMQYATAVLRKIPVCAGKIIGSWAPLQNYPSVSELSAMIV